MILGLAALVVSLGGILGGWRGAGILAGYCGLVYVLARIGEAPHGLDDDWP